MSEKHVVFLDMPGSRVYLRPTEKSDLLFFRQALNNERIAKFLMHHLPVFEVDEEEWFAGLHKRKDTDLTLSIVLKETHEVIGSMGLHRIDWISRTATTGSFIGREDLLGKGLGTEAKMLLLKHAFLTLDLRQVYSKVHDFNGRSKAYALKCGYKEIARYPEHIFRDGQFYDLVHFLVTPKEWMPLWQGFQETLGK